MIDKDLLNRANSKCELCSSSDNLVDYLVSPKSGDTSDDYILTCSTCQGQIEDTDTIDPNHWRCLNDSMWSEVDAVKVVSYRMLHNLKNESWSQDLIDMFYMDDETKAWAESGITDEEDKVVHYDSNGVVLNNGDSVVLIQDLKVKGGGFTAKRGTAVRRISLVWDNPEHIEGKVEGQSIVILTQYVKKTS